MGTWKQTSQLRKPLQTEYINYCIKVLLYSILFTYRTGLQYGVQGPTSPPSAGSRRLARLLDSGEEASMIARSGRSEGQEQGVHKAGQQPMPHGGLQPLAFFSKKFNPAQLNYSTFDRELLAVYLAIRRFWDLL